MRLVFTRAEALEAGWTHRRIKTRLGRGEWRAVRRGVYIEEAVWSALDAVGRYRQKCFAEGIGREVAIWGPSAAAVHGFDLLNSATAELHVRRTSEVDGKEVEHIDGVVVSAPDVAVIDSARLLGVESGLVIADSALRAGRVTRQQLQQGAVRCHNWRGCQHAVDVALLADALAESPLESVSRYRMHLAGLPCPELQITIDLPSGRVRVDFLWRQQRVVGEADGMVKYTDAEVLRMEKRRQVWLEDAGYQVVRWVWDEIWRQPWVVMQRIQRALIRAS
jgi:very-short-patch-repair endonuclease